MPSLIAFTDAQMDAIRRAAEPLARPERSLFLEEVVAALDCGVVGDGAVFKGGSRAAAALPGAAKVGNEVGEPACPRPAQARHLTLPSLADPQKILVAQGYLELAWASTPQAWRLRR